ncbi:asparagine synthetase A, partial [Treponema pallidum]
VVPVGSRNLAYLKDTVRKVYGALRESEVLVSERFGLRAFL